MKGRAFNLFQLSHSQLGLQWGIGEPAGAPSSSNVRALRQQLRSIWKGVHLGGKAAGWVREIEIGMRRYRKPLLLGQLGE